MVLYLQFILNTAVKGGFTLWRLIDPQGKPPGLLGWWPAKAVSQAKRTEIQIVGLYLV